MTPDAVDADLPDALDAIAAVPTLLVACDVDGTIAPIAAHPADAVVDADALTALDQIARLPRTTVALVSGRALLDLRAMTRLGPDVVLVGSHGAEHDDDVALAPAASLLLAQVLRDVRHLSDAVAGVVVEEKATGVAVHVRQATRSDAAQLVAAVLAGPATRPGVRTTHGKQVVELSVVDTDKGDAVDRLRRESGADAVVYAGDDVTDEWAFARLRPPDVGIKVGPGATGAGFRVATTHEMAPLLTLLAVARLRGIAGHRET